MSFSQADALRLAMAAENSSGRTSRFNISTRGIQLTDAEAEAIMEAYHIEEEKEKTWTRRFVESKLQHYKWYFPRKDIPGAPSLQKAWAYFEHVTLPRHFTGEKSAGAVLRRAEPGEQGDTELYHAMRTSQANLIEFGTGIDLYFQTCALLCLMFFLAGLVNIPNIYYYAANYSGEKHRGWALEGSAVCTQTYWAVCEDCATDQVELDEVADRVAVAADGTVLVLRNDCEVGLEQGIVNWATWIFFFFFLTGISLYLQARETRFDQDKLTAGDYSVMVKNPPPDATDPDKWRDYFEQFAEKQVTLVTVHLNNEEMLKKLMERRKKRDLLRRMLKKGTNMDDENALRVAVDDHIRERDLEPKGCFGSFLECTVFWPLKMIGLIHAAETLLEKVNSLTEEIKEFQKRRYEVSKVFVTFETEEGQRAAMAALSVRRIDISMNNVEKAPPCAVFHDRVLRVVQPTEPSAVRFMDQSTTKLYRSVSVFLTFGVTIALISLAAFLEDITRQKWGPQYSGPLVSIFNGIIPLFVHVLMLFERHQTEELFQSSLYLKITIFRWVNTAVVINYITPFTNSLGGRSTDLLPSISAILWSETFIVPALRLLDIGGKFQRHVLAPRAMTQEQMNLNFLGTPYNLGERYTDLTKVLFVCFFYSALFPASFWFGFAILLVQYHADKWCLLRIWGYSPSLGNTLAVYSRKYFFTGASLAFIIASAYAWAQFPYDDVCDKEGESVTRTEIPYTGVTLLKDILAAGTEGEAATVNITVGQEESVYFCSQGYRGRPGINFPPQVEDQPGDLRWMTESQETLVNVYYWSVIFAVVVFVLGSFLTTIVNTIKTWLSSHYEERGASQKIDFSCNLDIEAYVPRVKLRTYPFPFLAANVDDLDERLLGFTDKDNSVDHHNMVFDVPYPGMHRTKRMSPDQPAPPQSETPVADSQSEDQQPIFGVVKHYPPPWYSESPPNELDHIVNVG